jgi:hypothetical protein
MKKARTKMLLQSQIEAAHKVTRSNRAAAEYLRVSYNFYKKYAKVYKNIFGETLFDAHKNQSGLGISKPNVSKRRFKLDDILTGKHPKYPTKQLFRRLIVGGYVEEKCNQCGFHQKRPTDLKTPLLLNHIDGDRTNHKIDNLEVLCYNCYFILVGDLNRVDIRTNFYDRPEQEIVDITQNSESLQALSELDLLSDEEKQTILNNLQNL